MALALVRRILLEQGRELSPDALGAEPAHVGSLEMWLHFPHAALDGRTPLDALQSPNGEALVRAILVCLVEESNAARGTAKHSKGQAGE